MKVEIQQGGQKPGEVKYPCVMTHKSWGILIATGEKSGMWIEYDGAITIVNDNNLLWTDSPMKLATGPVTITLTNE